MNITVVTLYVGDGYENKVKLATKSKEIYCAKHSYNLFVGNHLHDKSRPPAWSKVLALKEALLTSKSDYIVWLDADIMIMNYDVKLEQFIQNNMDNKDFMFGDENPLNSGVIFIKNTDYASELLSLVYGLYNPSDKMWDQLGFAKAYNENLLNFRDRTKIEPERRLFNATNQQYKYGDFNIHILGTRTYPSHFLGALLAEHCSFKRDDEDENTFNERINMLKTKYV